MIMYDELAVTKEEADLIERVRRSDEFGCSRCLETLEPVNYDGWKIGVSYHKLKIKRYDDKLEVGITYCPFCGRYLKSEGE